MLPSLFLLHGALGTGDQFEKLKELLSVDYQVVAFTLSGHGEKPFPETGFSVSGFSAEISEFMDQEGVKSAHFFGHSMGGYIALHLAISEPERVKGVFTLGTKFWWTPEIALAEAEGLDPQRIKEKAPRFAQSLQERHGTEKWEDLLRQTADLLIDLGNNPPVNKESSGKISCPVIIGIGTEDQMVTIEESEEVANWITEGRLRVFEGMQHPIEKADVMQLEMAIREFVS